MINDFNMNHQILKRLPYFLTYTFLALSYTVENEVLKNENMDISK